MRNTKEYPITIEEILQCLDRVINEHRYGEEKGAVPIGDMTALLLQKAKDIILTGWFDPT